MVVYFRPGMSQEHSCRPMRVRGSEEARPAVPPHEQGRKQTVMTLPGPGAEAALVEAAGRAACAAYAPYSGFKVGAALLAGDGQIVTGCNVENASFGLTICAERAVVCRAVADGLRDFAALAVCAPGGAPPCGACRQVLHEFSPVLRVVLCSADGDILARHNLSALLPHSFDPVQLDKG